MSAGNVGINTKVVDMRNDGIKPDDWGDVEIHITQEVPEAVLLGFADVLASNGFKPQADKIRHQTINQRRKQWADGRAQTE